MKTNFFIFLLVILFSTQAFAQPGTLDLSFGKGGKDTTGFTGSDSRANSIAIQKDGKIIIAGSSSGGPVNGFSFCRYNSNGILDSTYGINGKQISPYPQGTFIANSTAIQEDGKLVIAGKYFFNGVYDIGIGRFNDKGNPDSSFGINGKLIFSAGLNNDEALSVIIQPDGKIVVTGYTSDNGVIYDFAVARFQSNGYPDSSFGINGLVKTNFEGNLAYGRSLSLQTDGKIIVAGYYYNNSSLDYDFALIRYKINGSIDSTFGTNGKVSTDFGLSDEVYSLKILPDSKILAIGNTGTNSGIGNIAMARYNSTGLLDSSFGIFGKVISDFNNSYELVQSATIQNDGKIVVAGVIAYSNSNNNDFLLIRYKTNGSVDSTFGTNGRVITDILGDFDFGKSLALQEDGKIVVTGFASGFGRTVFAIARYNNDIVTDVFQVENTFTSIYLYPNPTYNYFIIKGLNKFKKSNISIFDISGRLIKQINSYGSESLLYNCSGLTTGVYIISIKTGKQIVANKIFKK